MTNPLVSARGLTKHFDELVAVDGIRARGGKWGLFFLVLERTVKETQSQPASATAEQESGSNASRLFGTPLNP